MFQIDKQKKLMRLTDDQKDIGKNILESERVAETCTLAAAGGFLACLACSNEQSADIAMLPCMDRNERIIV